MAWRERRLAADKFLGARSDNVGADIAQRGLGRGRSDVFLIDGGFFDGLTRDGFERAALIHALLSRDLRGRGSGGTDKGKQAKNGTSRSWK